jgi:hypothetical protein
LAVIWPLVPLKLPPAMAQRAGAGMLDLAAGVADARGLQCQVLPIAGDAPAVVVQGAAGGDGRRPGAGLHDLAAIRVGEIRDVDLQLTGVELPSVVDEGLCWLLLAVMAGCRA